MEKNYLVILVFVFVLMAGLIVPVSAGPLAHCYGFNYPPLSDASALDTRAVADLANNQLLMGGYTSYSLPDSRAIDAYYNLKNDAVFFFDGHGDSGALMFYNHNNGYPSYILAQNDQRYPWPYANPRYYLSSLTTELKDVKLAVYLSCHSGDTNPNWGNLVDVSYSKGVDNVIGFKDIVGRPAAAYWGERFFYNSITKKQTISYSAYTASRDYNYIYKRYEGLDSMYIRQRDASRDRLIPAVYGIV